MSNPNPTKVQTLRVPREALNYWMGFHGTIQDSTEYRLPAGATVTKTYWDTDGAYCVVYTLNVDLTAPGTTPVRQDDAG